MIVRAPLFVYDGDGKPTCKFTGGGPDSELTYAHLAKFVQELIAPTWNKKGE
ncbi:MAG: hypothetical protein L0215_19810 [Gemmataceae bacterium]|nr:hypothetical protein [Gemmataceae bacterium]MCI0419666.1 hypothetical protein [Acidobacteriota bacterium]